MGSKLSKYDVLRKPLVTEKASMISAFEKVVFEVRQDASKTDVKRAVEFLWNVKVSSVNTQVRKGKVKRFRGVLGTRSDTKIAIVTIEQGRAVDVLAGV